MVRSWETVASSLEKAIEVALKVRRGDAVKIYNYDPGEQEGRPTWVIEAWV